MISSRSQNSVVSEVTFLEQFCLFKLYVWMHVCMHIYTCRFFLTVNFYLVLILRKIFNLGKEGTMLK